MPLWASLLTPLRQKQLRAMPLTRLCGEINDKGTQRAWDSPLPPRHDCVPPRTLAASPHWPSACLNVPFQQRLP